MTKDEAITHFWEFLFETGAACEYVEAFEADLRYETFDDLVNALWNLGYLIDEAFDWGNSEISSTEWYGLHNAWGTRLYELNNCK